MNLIAMLRPPSLYFGQRIFVQKQTVRNKVVRPASFLKPPEKIKLYNRENKELFGALLETNKQRKSRLRKEAKNRPHQNNAASTKESTQKFDIPCENVLKNLIQIQNSAIRRLEAVKGKMWLKTRTCSNLASVLFNGTPVRGMKTQAAYFAQSSPAQPGYASEDKILQIKQYQNDFTQQFPSVTLILNKTMTEDTRKALDKWKQDRIAELGEEEFNRAYQAQLAVGTKFHNTLKNYFTQPQTQLRIEKDVEGVWVSVAEVLKSISSPKAIESNVVHPVLKYRGIFDAIADYEDKPTLIEWKKSDKARKAISATYDNPVQLAAYFGAVCNDLNYKHLNVRDALLVIAYTDGSKADVFHLSTDKLREHWAQWLIRLEEYTKKYGNDDEKILKGGKRTFEENLGNI
ncbi:mitochondrial genome maintenance exonuclease 1 [Bicyclus anynana]|uniref:Mitochondrial genome maintenance exonuclease 1 n=1 Tax=Bicyclus anynana TaxID=110368 RepID=A0A6J1N9K6_BICAN|nr:mitochondrial genome maintenance exonuclease 1 [Bicyclus anynana]